MKTLAFFLLLLSFQGISQEVVNKLIYKDSIHELTMLNELNLENISTIKICQGQYDCKGFINDYDTLNSNSESIDIRAIITRIKDFEYKIEINIGILPDF